MLIEFDFEITYIKGKENKIVDALSRRVKLNHLATIISYGTELQDKIKSVGQEDKKY